MGISGLRKPIARARKLGEALLLVVCACALGACDAPPERLSEATPPPRPAKVDQALVVRELADDVGLLGHRLGEVPSAAVVRELQGVKLRAIEVLPDDLVSPGVAPFACYGFEDAFLKEAKVFVDGAGRVELLALIPLLSPDEYGELMYLSPTVALYRWQESRRGTTYWQCRRDGKPPQSYASEYRVATGGFVAFAGAPPERYFPGAEPISAWLARLEGPPLEALRVAVTWFHAPERMVHPALTAWLERRGGEVFAAALAAGEHELATRLLAWWDARRYPASHFRPDGHDAERLRELVRAADIGAFVHYAELRGANFRGVDLRAFEGGDTPLILFQFWRDVRQLEQQLAKKSWSQTELRRWFRHVEIGIPANYGGGREIHLSPDHDRRRDAVIQSAARILHAHFGDAKYPEVLVEVLADTTRFEGARLQELFFDPLGDTTRLDGPSLRRSQLRAVLERKWPDEKARGGAVAEYLERVRANFTTAAEFEEERRALLMRLAASPAAYEALVLAARKAPRTADPELIDWLPEQQRTPIVERLRAQAEREARIAAIERDLAPLIDFERRPSDLGLWSSWHRATVRDGREAPRFEAAERGAASLREYLGALEAASVEARTRWLADEAKRRAFRRFTDHYGSESFALFVALPLHRHEQALSLALRTLEPVSFADATIAFQEGYAEMPAPTLVGDAYRDARAFAESACRHRDAPRRAANRIIALLQDRHLRQHAHAYLERHGEEAFLGCLLPLAMHWVDQPELVNEWCNYGVATSAMIREYLRRGTIHFETEAGTFASLNLTGPAEIVRYGDLFALRPRGNADIAGTYRYTARLRRNGRELTAEGSVTVSPLAVEGPRLHRAVRQELTTKG